MELCRKILDWFAFVLACGFAIFYVGAIVWAAWQVRSRRNS